MTEFPKSLQGLLHPSKALDFSQKLQEIYTELENAIKITHEKGKDYVVFTIPNNYKYMKKEALENIMANLVKEGYHEYPENFYDSYDKMHPRTFILFKLKHTFTDGESYEHKIGTTIDYEEAIGIIIKFF